MEQLRISQKGKMALCLAYLLLAGCGGDDKSTSDMQFAGPTAVSMGKMGSQHAPRYDHRPAKNKAPANRPAQINNKPAAEVVAGDTYVFQTEADDPDGDPLSFRIRNRPSWLQWDRKSGRLWGTPADMDVGPYPGITIFVSDGITESEFGPFIITVLEKPDDIDPPSTAQRKFNPGHYISMNRWDDQGHMVEALKPGVIGLQKRYMWKDLETAFGIYDFSAIESDLNLLAGQGSRLVVFVEDISFNEEIPTPGYLHALHTIQNKHGGYTAKRWAPYVTERFSLLLEALGAQFDMHPAFEGIAVQESALSLASSVLDDHGYTAELYRDALIEVIVAAREAFPNSQVFWYMNFLPRNQGYIAEIANAAVGADVAMGGPDVLPDDYSLTTHTYPYYTDFEGKLTQFSSMQFNSYRHPHRDKSFPTKYWTMSELFDFARDQLHVRYLFWNRVAKSDPADSYNWAHALPVIDATANFGHAN